MERIRGEDPEKLVRPSKRLKKTIDDSWGLEELPEDQESARRWSTSTGADVPTGESKQGVLKNWTWLELEARVVVREIADKIEAEHLKRSVV